MPMFGLYEYNAFVYSSLLTFLTVFALVLYRGLSLCSVIYRPTSSYYRPIRSLVHANRDTDVYLDCTTIRCLKVISLL